MSDTQEPYWVSLLNFVDPYSHRHIVGQKVSIDHRHCLIDLIMVNNVGYLFLWI